MLDLKNYYVTLGGSALYRCNSPKDWNITLRERKINSISSLRQRANSAFMFIRDIKTGEA